MTVHSDWGDWLPREISARDPPGLTAWYLGCNGIVLKAADGTTAFIDPYLGTGDPPRTVRMIPVPFDPADVRECDAVLATHEHTDHVHGPSQAPLLEGTGADYYAPADSLAVVREEGWTDRYDVAETLFQEVRTGETIDVGSLTVHVHQANDPDASQPVSYVVEHETGTFFHGGDARPGPEFSSVGDEYDLDVGVLAFGSAGTIPDGDTGSRRYTQWYSDENDVVEAASQLRLDRLVPTHWDMWKGLTADPSALLSHARSFEYPGRVEVLEIGDSVHV